MVETRPTVPGVLELYGDDAKAMRLLIRSIEDTLDSRGFQELQAGTLALDRMFKENLNHLGERFLSNLVYVSLNGEKDVVVLPEGTMRTYDFFKRRGINKAKAFYSQQFVRNENPDDVAKGKTRNFWQIGYEILGYEWLESSVDAIETASQIISAAGLPDVTIRMGDKRLMKGLLARVSPKDVPTTWLAIEKSNDDPEGFIKNYKGFFGEVDQTAEEIANFIGLIKRKDLSLNDLAMVSNQPAYQEGIAALQLIASRVSRNVKLQMLPFLSKSWDACDKLIFDARVPGYDAALAGGGNLTYTNYLPESMKSGAGIGVTRVFQVLKERGKI